MQKLFNTNFIVAVKFRILHYNSDLNLFISYLIKKITRDSGDRAFPSKTINKIVDKLGYPSGNDVELQVT